MVVTKSAQVRMLALRAVLGLGFHQQELTGPPYPTAVQ